MCAKDCKKFGLASVVAIVTTSVLGYVVHHLLLAKKYMEPQYVLLWNPQEAMKSRMIWMWLAYVLYGVVFVKIYDKGYEESKSALGQGLRYGLLMGLLAGPFEAMMSYFVYPVNSDLAIAWGFFGLAQSVILGAVVSLVYHPHSHSA